MSKTYDPRDVVISFKDRDGKETVIQGMTDALEIKEDPEVLREVEELRASMAEHVQKLVLEALSKHDKIPYTDQGIACVKAAILGVIDCSPYREAPEPELSTFEQLKAHAISLGFPDDSPMLDSVLHTMAKHEDLLSMQLQEMINASTLARHEDLLSMQLQEMINASTFDDPVLDQEPATVPFPTERVMRREQDEVDMNEQHSRVTGACYYCNAFEPFHTFDCPVRD